MSSLRLSKAASASGSHRTGEGGFACEELLVPMPAWFACNEMLVPIPARVRE